MFASETPRVRVLWCEKQQLTIVSGLREVGPFASSLDQGRT
jgi:hypothetical protein